MESLTTFYYQGPTELHLQDCKGYTLGWVG